MSTGTPTEAKDIKPQAEKEQSLPGLQKEMQQQPKYKASWYKGSDKLKDRVALITGGDSGIGRAVAVLFAREGAHVAINFLPSEKEDAEQTKKDVEAEGRSCLLLPGDLRDPALCADLVKGVMKAYNRLDILVNNAGTQLTKESIQELSDEQVRNTFATNILPMFTVSREALKHLPKNEGCIINTTSVVAFSGKANLLDYTATKGAIVSFTRALAGQLAKDGIRVNAVAPGPIWTPLIPASFEKHQLENWGKGTPLGRAGHPEEVSPAYVFLASKDSSFVTGQILHVNGGQEFV